MKQLKHWQDPVSALVGLWLIVSPWALGFQSQRNAMMTMVIIGVLLIAAAMGAIFVPHAWEEWSEGILGVCLAVSPWVVGFTGLQDAKFSAVASGVLVVVLALWVLTTDKDYAGWMRNTPAG